MTSTPSLDADARGCNVWVVPYRTAVIVTGAAPPWHHVSTRAPRLHLQELEKDCDIWYDRYLATQGEHCVLGHVRCDVNFKQSGATA